MNRLRQLCLFIFILVYLPLNARHTDLPVPDSLCIKNEVIPIAKRPWMAAGQVFSFNVGIWAFDRYVIDGPYAYISLNSVKRNLREGFHWDNDNFSTNLFNHPYHGSLYHNSARSNGFNFWQSGLYTIGGSLMWELFLECELPSTNDLIMTSIGGSSLGEMLFRTSDLILDNSTRGKGRVGREIAAFIVAPGRGLTRLLTGEAWKVTPNRGRQFYPPELRFSLAAGVKVLELRNMDGDAFDESAGIVFDGQIEYGDIFDEEKEPFSYFKVHIDLNIQKNQPLIGQLNIMGRLGGNMLYENKNNQLYWGSFLHFDYYNSDSLSYDQKVEGTKTPYVVGSPAAIGLGLIYKGRFFDEKLKVHAQNHINGILLGASLSDYYRGHDRNYNWGSGYSVKEVLNISFKDKFLLAINTDYYRLYTWRGYDPDMDFSQVDYKTLNVQGDRSKAYYTILESILGYEINSRWGIYYQRFDFFRKTNYKYLPDFKTTTSDTRLMVKYKF